MSLQDAIIKELIEDRVPLTLYLMNGFQMRGIIIKWDPTVIVLISDGAPKIIYKHSISTIAPMRPLKSTKVDHA